MTRQERLDWFAEARYGLFVHYGLYSLLGRGEWTMNKERIAPEDYERIADRFTCEAFDAEKICQLAVDGGMTYVNFTTMHHDGFRLYDSKLSDFTTTKTSSKRDLTAEMVAAAQKYGLKVSLYHSLNNWYDQPDAVDALEDKEKYEIFIDNTFARYRELVSNYDFDILWYDGWWPFHHQGWRARALNDMVRSIKPEVLFNGRNGLAGDFGTPEQHITPPDPWRPWEACITLNDHWGFHKNDHNWKPPIEVMKMLITVANNRGNLLLNIGPRGDGSIPEPSVKTIQRVGRWLKDHSECVFGVDKFTFGLREFGDRGEHRNDWCYHGRFTAKGDNLYLLSLYWPGDEMTLVGVKPQVKKIIMQSDGESLPFTQNGDKLVIQGLPETPPDDLCSVLRLECDQPPEVYLCAGMRVPNVPHPHYDPCESDIAHPE